MGYWAPRLISFVAHSGMRAQPSRWILVPEIQARKLETQAGGVTLRISQGKTTTV
jgi:hypothetical protein